MQNHGIAATPDRLRTLIEREIAAAGGRLPFDRFMELALYAPGLGYYVAGAPKFGPSGDFVTAPEISPLFGQCLAAQCAEALERLGGGDLCEFGAGSGALAEQLLTTLADLDALPRRYLILEPSPDLRDRQRARLRERLPRLADRCVWLEAWPDKLRGLVLANEVLDAMPVQRFRIGEDGGIEEAQVVCRDGALAEVMAPARSPGLIEAVRALQARGLATEPGYTSEINLRLAPWLRGLRAALEAGLALLIDYGYPAAAYYQPDRRQGTLLCHRRHQAHADPYLDPGSQDITAHVDFTAVAEAGLAAGFTLAGFTTQAHFLLGCGLDRWLSARPDAPDRTLDLALGARQLLLPSAMGERFKVLALSLGLDGPWRGFGIRDLRDRL